MAAAGEAVVGDLGLVVGGGDAVGMFVSPPPVSVPVITVEAPPPTTTTPPPPRWQTQTPGGIQQNFPTSFEAAREFRDAVDALAIEQNKEFSQWQEQCGGKSKVYVCKDFIHRKKAYEYKVRQEKPDPKAFLKKHPYKGEGSCGFRVSAYQSRTKGSTAWVLAKGTICLDHAATCAVVGKIKSRQLSSHSSFHKSVVAAKASLPGQGTKLTMRNIAEQGEQLGFGGNALSKSVVYYVASRASKQRGKTPSISADQATPGGPGPSGEYLPSAVPKDHHSLPAPAAKSSSVAAGARNVRMKRGCRVCSAAGRTGPETFMHKGSNCPFELDLASIVIPDDGTGELQPALPIV
eukprot:m.315572 g.315572  ORF g.315572 m.315572 type:complete len:349 (-) comp27525_c0_seq2:1453-2499(-)